MRILVIGGTGLISSAVVGQLAERGWEVTVFNRGLSRRELPPGVRRLTGDRSKSAEFEGMMAQESWDAVIDMVCFRPGEAESAVRAFQGRTAHYIMTSTVDVYQKPATLYPYREEEPYGGIGDYAIDKVACERVLWSAHARGDLPVTVLRPAATYGDLHPPVHSLGRRTSYLDRLRRGKTIVVHGDGTTLWVSCHADDVARAFVGSVANPGSIGRAYHVAGEEWLTWDGHHRAVAAAIGAPPPTIVHVPTEVLTRLAPHRIRRVLENFQFHSIFDNTAARVDLSFRYSITLGDGLPGWYRSLESAGLIENSDDDPTDDRVIAAWKEIVSRAPADVDSHDPGDPHWT
jgi:nucleoside-diphosphate-sugar epimerase